MESEASKADQNCVAWAERWAASLTRAFGSAKPEASAKAAGSKGAEEGCKKRDVQVISVDSDEDPDGCDTDHADAPRANAEQGAQGADSGGGGRKRRAGRDAGGEPKRRRPGRDGTSDELNDLMRIPVRTGVHTDVVITVAVRPSDTVGVVKNLIYGKVGLSDRWRLIHTRRGQTIKRLEEDGRTVSECGVDGESTLHIIPLLTGVCESVESSDDSDGSIYCLECSEHNSNLYGK